MLITGWEKASCGWHCCVKCHPMWIVSVAIQLSENLFCPFGFWSKSPMQLCFTWIIVFMLNFNYLDVLPPHCWLNMMPISMQHYLCAMRVTVSWNNCLSGHWLSCPLNEPSHKLALDTLKFQFRDVAQPQLLVNVQPSTPQQSTVFNGMANCLCLLRADSYKGLLAPRLLEHFLLRPANRANRAPRCFQMTHTHALLHQLAANCFGRGQLDFLPSIRQSPSHLLEFFSFHWAWEDERCDSAWAFVLCRVLLACWSTWSEVASAIKELGCQSQLHSDMECSWPEEADELSNLRNLTSDFSLLRLHRPCQHLRALSSKSRRMQSGKPNWKPCPKDGGRLKHCHQHLLPSVSKLLWEIHKSESNQIIWQHCFSFLAPNRKQGGRSWHQTCQTQLARFGLDDLSQC